MSRKGLGESRDPPGLFKDDGEGVVGEPFNGLLGEGVGEKGAQFFPQKSGEGNPSSDPAPEREEVGSEETVFEIGKSAQEYGEERRSFQIGLGEETELVEGVVTH